MLNAYCELLSPQHKPLSKRPKRVGLAGGQEEGEEVPTRGDQNLVGIPAVSSLHSHLLISKSDAG